MAPANPAATFHIPYNGWGGPPKGFALARKNQALDALAVAERMPVGDIPPIGNELAQLRRFQSRRDFRKNTLPDNERPEQQRRVQCRLGCGGSLFFSLPSCPLG